MRGTLSIPEAHGSQGETPQAEIGSALDNLRAAAPRWGSTGVKVRAAMARRAIDDVLAVSEDWVVAACRAKQIDPHGPRAGEEWQSGPHLTIRLLRLMADTLDHLDQTGNPPVGKVRRRDDGTTAVEVFPADLWDRLLFAGVRGEVWTHREWSLRDSLIDSVASKLGDIPLRHAYYPGAFDRWAEYVDTYDDARRFGDHLPHELPWTLISVLPDDTPGMCFETECFNGIVSETSLGADSVADYIEAAVDFCNQRLWGTLGATLIVHPESMKDASVAAAVDRAIADLRYGSVSVNIWVAVVYAAVTTTWGAHPGHTLDDIGSGRGVVHNARLFDRPLKSVVWAPFRQVPKPVWFASHKTSHRALRALTHHEAAPSLASLLKVAFHAARG